MNGKDLPKDLLNQLQNLALNYNLKVTPRRRISIEKPSNAFQLLIPSKNSQVPDNSNNSSEVEVNMLQPKEFENNGLKVSMHKQQNVSDKPQRSMKHKKYSIEEKRELIALCASPNQTDGKIAKLKGVPKTNLQRWQAEFEKNTKDFGKDMRIIKNGKKVKHPELDKHIEEWFTKLRSKKVAISGLMVIEEATLYCQLHNVTDLNLSNGWLCKLLRRLNIVKRKVTKVSQKSALQFESEIKQFVSLIMEYR